MSTPEPIPRTRDLATIATTVGLAVLALAPVLVARGFVLIGDMSFVPVQPWRDEWLGLDGSVPRAVPADAIVSVLTHVVPGDLVQKAILVAALVAAALGMVRLARTFVTADARWAPLGAAVLYLWNPWVLERLAIGHWGLLVGYAAMPWVVIAALAVRRGGGGLPLLVIALGIAAFGSPTGGVVAGLVAAALCASRGRQVVGVLAAALVVNLPWLLPGLLGSAGPTDPSGVQAFAARSDTPFGVLGSLLTFGGIWKASIVPGERGSWLLVLLALLVTIAGLMALVAGIRARGQHASTLRALAALGLAGFVLAAIPTTRPGLRLSVWLVDHVAGAGILRDSQKWLLLTLLAVCVGFAMALEKGGRWLRANGLGPGLLTGVAALLPVVVLPTLAWGISGKLEPVHYPAEWAQVRTVLDALPDRRTAVLPWATYRSFAWNGDRAALDPAIRFFSGQVITDDALRVSAVRTVAGESPVAALIGEALDQGQPLAPVLTSAGVRYLLVEKEAPGDERAIAQLRATATVRYDGSELELLDLGRGTAAPHVSYAALVVLGDVLAFGAVLGAGLFLTVRRIRRIPVNIG
jgi:hypothetical protein